MSTDKHEFHPMSVAAMRAKAKEPTGAVVDFDLEKEPSKTVQSEKDNCDLNVILRRMEKAGPEAYADTIDALMLAATQVQFGDASRVGDYKTVQDNIAIVKSEFALLPADVRSRFQNNAAVLIEFLADPANIPEAVSLGLVAAPEAVNGPVAAPVAPQGAEGGVAPVAPAAAPQPAG